MKFHFDYLCGDAANTCFICLHIYSGSTRRTERLWRYHRLFERLNDADEFDLDSFCDKDVADHDIAHRSAMRHALA
jgi:hypothetical protein